MRKVDPKTHKRMVGLNQDKPKKVSLNRLQQVSDSLKNEEARKTIGGTGLIMDNKADLGREALRSAAADRERYTRYDNIIKKHKPLKP